MRRQLTFAIGIVVIALAGVIYTITSGNEPLLGLDLQGGASVVLEPEPNEDGSEISDEVLDQAVDIIRNRVDWLGVREPEISRQGSTILVQIPGVEDQQRAIELVGQTAELRFRPLLQETFADFPFAEASIALCPPGSTEGDDGLLGQFDAPTPDADADECMVAVDRADPGCSLPAWSRAAARGSAGKSRCSLDWRSAPDCFGSTPGYWGVGRQYFLQVRFAGIDDFNALASECSSRHHRCARRRAPRPIRGKSLVELR